MPLFGPPNIEKLAARRDVKALIKALSYEKDIGVQCDAARALGEIGDPSAISPLIALLGAGYLGKTASQALVQIGAPAVEPLIAALAQKGSNLPSALLTLGAIGDRRAIEPMVACLADRRWVHSAADALVAFGSPAISPLCAAIGHLDSECGAQAIQALVRIGSPDALAALGDVVKCEPNKRKLAAAALCKVGAPAIDALIDALRVEEDAEVLAMIRVALLGLGEAALSALIAALASADEQIATEAAAVLCQTGAPAVESLLAVLQKASPRVRRLAAEVLGQIGDQRAVGGLSLALDDPDDRVGYAAARALRQMGDERGFPVIDAFTHSREIVTETVLAIWKTRLALWEWHRREQGAAWIDCAIKAISLSCGAVAGDDVRAWAEAYRERDPAAFLKLVVAALTHGVEGITPQDVRGWAQACMDWDKARFFELVTAGIAHHAEAIGADEIRDWVGRYLVTDRDLATRIIFAALEAGVPGITPEDVHAWIAPCLGPDIHLTLAVQIGVAAVGVNGLTAEDIRRWLRATIIEKMNKPDARATFELGRAAIQAGLPGLTAADVRGWMSLVAEIKEEIGHYKYGRTYNAFVQLGIAAIDHGESLQLDNSEIESWIALLEEAGQTAKKGLLQVAAYDAGYYSVAPLDQIRATIAQALDNPTGVSDTSAGARLVHFCLERLPQWFTFDEAVDWLGKAIGYEQAIHDGTFPIFMSILRALAMPYGLWVTPTDRMAAVRWLMDRVDGMFERGVEGVQAEARGFAPDGYAARMYGYGVQFAVAALEHEIEGLDAERVMKWVSCYTGEGMHEQASRILVAAIHNTRFVALPREAVRSFIAKMWELGYRTAAYAVMLAALRQRRRDLVTWAEFHARIDEEFRANGAHEAMPYLLQAYCEAPMDGVTEQDIAGWRDRLIELRETIYAPELVRVARERGFAVDMGETLRAKRVAFYPPDLRPEQALTRAGWRIYEFQQRGWAISRPDLVRQVHHLARLGIAQAKELGLTYDFTHPAGLSIVEALMAKEGA